MSRDITILGAGIVGICTALSLQEQGHNVRLLDRDAPGQGASSGNAGIVSPWSIVPQSMPGMWKKVPGWLLDSSGPLSIRPSYLPRVAGWGLRFLAQGREARVRQISAAMDLLCRDCIALYRHHLNGSGAEGLLKDSYYVHVFRDENGGDVSELGYQLRRDAGAEIERLNAGELRELEPALSPEFRSAIVIKGQARSVSPGAMGAALARKFQRQGGTIERCEIKAIRPTDTGAWQVDTDTGTLRAPKLILAMGVWSAALLKPLGIRIPLEAERGYHVCFTNPGIKLNHSVMDVDMKYVASSMQEGLRVAGTAEFAGLDAKQNDKRLTSLVSLTGGLSEQLNRESFTTWSGQRPSLPDSLPCIGEIDGLPNLIAAFGHSHYGLMMAPKTGRLVADIATGVSQNVDLSPFNPTRF